MENEKWIWWKHGVIYCLYPRSFYDSNSDGIGDLQGIIQKLDYLSELGIDAIWLTPIYASPLKDWGYDVEDYRKIAPEYGSLDDFKALLDEAHKRNIKVIMDLILNHTSNQHKWFLESRASKDNPKRKWYIWEDPVDGKPPNNWKNVFGGSAWEYDEKTNQYYLHTFLKEQPDLNWRNKSLKKNFFKIIRYWLELGVDGFRLDAINMIIKDKKLRNNPGFISAVLHKRKFQTRDRTKSIKILKKFRELLDEYQDKMSVGEIYALPPGDSALIGKYLSAGDDSLDMAFDFSLIYKPWTARSYFKCIDNMYNHIPDKGWPSLVFSNHDLLRNINRIKWRTKKLEKAKVTAVLMMTLKGTPFLYYGEELGMYNASIKRSEIKDSLGKKYWPIFSGRDQARTPMQWNSEQYAGFSKVKPWLSTAKNYENINYLKLKDHPNSIFVLYKNLIQIRKKHQALHSGRWKVLIKGESGLLAYNRYTDDENILVILNFSGRYRTADIGNVPYEQILSTHNNKTFTAEKTIRLQPFEAVVLLEHNKC